ncbi:MAG: AAA family ATPase [Rhodobiaceae bacterium]|nr:AAA family ATPase [Rhodobiaceae bacterium]
MGRRRQVCVRSTPRKAAHVIVVGNEKGGSGKSTISMHIIVHLLNLGQRAASIDLDCRQRSPTSYVITAGAGPRGRASGSGSRAFFAFAGRWRQCPPQRGARVHRIRR